jgi:2,4-dichlorophenol 6-monooxygenase
VAAAEPAADPPGAAAEGPAEELSPGRIRFGHELVGLEQDGRGVRATVRDNASGRRYAVRCQYLLGADGGRRVASLAGVGYEGLGVVTQTATLHVSAGLSPWARDPDVLIRWIFSPQAGVLVVMVPMGPQRWGPASEEWVIHLNYPAGDPRAQSDAQVEAGAREALGVPDLPMKIHKITRWSVEAVMASAFRAGRVFLVGDAAHRPPAHRRPGTDQRDPRLGTPSPDHQRRRDPGPPGPVHRLAVSGRQRRAPGCARCRA